MKKFIYLLGFLILSACQTTEEVSPSTDTSTEEITVSSEPEETGFTDELQAVVKEMGEGRYLKTIEFIYWNEEENTYSPLGMTVMYPYSLSFQENNPNLKNKTYEELVNYFKTKGDAMVSSFEETEHGIVVKSGGLGAYDYVDGYFPFITGGEYTNKDVYHLYGDGMTVNNTLRDEAIQMWLDTVEFYK
jgi:hypothetical protein